MISGVLKGGSVKFNLGDRREKGKLKREAVKGQGQVTGAKDGRERKQEVDRGCPLRSVEGRTEHAAGRLVPTIAEQACVLERVGHTKELGVGTTGMRE